MYPMACSQTHSQFRPSSELFKIPKVARVTRCAGLLGSIESWFDFGYLPLAAAGALVAKIAMPADRASARWRVRLIAPMLPPVSALPVAGRWTRTRALVQNAAMPTNYERAFADRPQVYAAWQGLIGAIKARMDLRRYELATLAAARRLRSSYCCLAHGKVLLELGEPVRAIAIDHRDAGLGEVDVAVMDLAERVVDDATSIGDADLQRLRDLGLSDAEIMDVVLTAAARCFFSKTLDALGVRADSSYRAMDAPVRDALVVGRPIAEES
jgi:alkylhydroperoxidase family enzyme